MCRAPLHPVILSFASDPFRALESACWERGFVHTMTGGNCTAFIRCESDAPDAREVYLTSDDGPEIPESLDAPCILGTYEPDGTCVSQTRYATAREALALFPVED